MMHTTCKWNTDNAIKTTFHMIFTAKRKGQRTHSQITSFCLYEQSANIFCVDMPARFLDAINSTFDSIFTTIYINVKENVFFQTKELKKAPCNMLTRACSIVQTFTDKSKLIYSQSDCEISSKIVTVVNVYFSLCRPGFW